MKRGTEHVETLEGRTLLSAVVHGKSLIIQAGKSAADVVSVALSGDKSQVQVTVNGTVNLFAKTRVKDLVVRTFAGDDTITIDSAVGGSVTIDSGDGNDTITVGAGRAQIFAGKGNDNITTGAGADVIFAGAGDDTIVSGDGKDAIYAEAGNDLVDAGLGNDLVHGGKGDDTLNGNDGNDRLWGQDGADSINGGAGDDTLGGIIGVNTLIGGDGKDTFYVKTSLDGQTNDYDSAIDVIKARDAIHAKVEA